MYVAVIIGVNAVVYAVCKCARRFNPLPIHIKGVGFAKVWEVLCEFDVRGVQIGFAKVLYYFRYRNGAMPFVGVFIVVKEGVK